jgi:hypothetical protein
MPLDHLQERHGRGHRSRPASTGARAGGRRAGSREAATYPDEPSRAITNRPCCAAAMACDARLRGGRCAGDSSMACKGSGVQIPSAPPGTTHRQDSRSGPLARDLPESHCWWQLEHSERGPFQATSGHSHRRLPRRENFPYRSSRPACGRPPAAAVLGPAPERRRGRGLPPGTFRTVTGRLAVDCWDFDWRNVQNC